MSKITVVIGLDRGDEAKGRITDIYSDNANLILKNNGGANAGHSIKIGEELYKLHHIPAGVFRPNVVNLLGAGMIVNPKTFAEEINELTQRGIDTSNVFIDGSVHVNLPYLYSYMDGEQENHRKISIGSTKRGISPTYSNKYSRYGIRFWDLINNINDESFIPSAILKLYNKNNIEYDLTVEMSTKDIAAIKEAWPIINNRIVDGRKLIREHIEANKNIVVESSQGCWLDLNLGQYPFVTSCDTTAASACIGSGIGVREIDSIVGVFKAYSTYVGNGSFVAECDIDTGDWLREKGAEYGTTTFRPRRVGFLEIPMIKDAIKINSTTELALVKLDVLSGLDKIKVVRYYKLDGKTIDYVPSNPYDYSRCEPVYKELDGWKEDISNVRSFVDLPENARKYIYYLSGVIGGPISIVSVGPEREQYLRLDEKYFKGVI